MRREKDLAFERVSPVSNPGCHWSFSRNGSVSQTRLSDCTAPRARSFSPTVVTHMPAGSADGKKPACGGPGVVALLLGFSVFLVGGVIGLALYLTDGGGSVVVGGGGSDGGGNTNTGDGGGETAACAPGFWGADCTACPLCGLHGACNGTGTTAGNGACICATGWVGDDCQACAVGFWGPTCAACPSCSGHGTCDGSGTTGGDGTCICDTTADTAFAGADCDACVPGFFGPGCQECTVACGENGRCADGKDGGGDTCLCDAGWAGPRCDVCNTTVAWSPNSTVGDMRCLLGPGGNSGGSSSGGTGPVREISVCGGHGTLQRSGACTCEVGWSGAGCTIEVCEEGRWGDQCSECEKTNANGICNGHGTCNGNGFRFGTGQCMCEGNWAGPRCEACKDGVSGAECTVLCPPGGPGGGLVCSGHGTCDGDGTALISGGSCTCFPGFSGDDCSTPAAESPACNASSVCAQNNGTCTAAGGCDCAYDGLDNNTLCSDLLPGWYQMAGQQPQECPGGKDTPCNGHGTCSQKHGTCNCAAGWAGDACSECAYGYFGSTTSCSQCPGFAEDGNGRVSVCSDHGVCNSATGLCACTPPSWTGANCSDCAAGFWGDQCWSCPRGNDGGSGNNNAVCSGHGTCHDGQAGNGACDCAADGAFLGQACGACAADHWGPSCGACPVANGRVCNDQGTCSGAGTQGGTGECQCYTHHTGAACDACAPNRFGPSCEACPGLTADGLACSGHGVCAGAGSKDSSGGTCTCTGDGWRGADCSEKVPCAGTSQEGADGVCSGHGNCVDDTCFCANGFAGDDCSTRVIDAEVCSPACAGLNERCVNRQCQSTAPPGDPCATETCSDRGLCANGICTCDPGYSGTQPACAVAPTSGTALVRWDATEWGACNQACGDTGSRERTVQCWDETAGARVSDSVCTAAFPNSGAPERFQPCHRFACGSEIGIAGLQLALPFGR